MSNVCRICGNSENNVTHRTREMMFGMRDEFDYVECAVCRTLQIAKVPDLSKYYPKNYYSLDLADDVEIGKTLPRRLGARAAGKYLVKGRGAVGKLVLDKKPWLLDHFPPSLREPILNLRLDSKILDVGCGSGLLLQSMHHFGFKDLQGADPFIDKDIHYTTGVNIRKQTLGDILETFDVVMLHHSFEHLPEPLVALSEIYRLVRPGGFALIRMPVVAEAWERYGTNWIQLDPPRHLFLFTEETFRSMARDAGFVDEKTVYDSGAFQFWGSEQYLLDMPLRDSRSLENRDAVGIFTKDQMAGWEAEAVELNRSGRGDQASYYLRRP